MTSPLTSSGTQVESRRCRRRSRTRAWPAPRRASRGAREAHGEARARPRREERLAQVGARGQGRGGFEAVVAVRAVEHDGGAVGHGALEVAGEHVVGLVLALGDLQDLGEVILRRSIGGLARSMSRRSGRPVKLLDHPVEAVRQAVSSSRPRGWRRVSRSPLATSRAKAP